MNIYPAIDLQDGQIVRLQQGDLTKPTIYGDDPIAQARAFFGMGAKCLHIVDLDGAKTGRSKNREIIEKIVRTIGAPIQVGGGIRTMAAIEHWFNIGVRRIILGTAAVYDPQLMQNACARYPGRIFASIDARDGQVAVSGWVEATGLKAIDFALRCKTAGAGGIVYTDISRDGMLGGINLESTAELAQAVGLPVVASGGIGSLDDVRAVLKLKTSGVEGLIIGRALYDGTVDLKNALAVAGGMLA